MELEKVQSIKEHVSSKNDEPIIDQDLEENLVFKINKKLFQCQSGWPNGSNRYRISTTEAKRCQKSIFAIDNQNEEMWSTIRKYKRSKWGKSIDK